MRHDSEGEYFHRMDAELIDALRHSSELEQRRLLLAEASRIDDRNILEALDKLGYNAWNVSLLYLLPAVQVAWAGGWVRDAERDCVTAIAMRHGLNRNTLTFQHLESWLDEPPSDDVATGSWQAIEAALERLSSNERLARVDAILRECSEVALASGGLFHKISPAARKLIAGFERRLMLRQVASA